MSNMCEGVRACVCACVYVVLERERESGMFQASVDSVLGGTVSFSLSFYL